MGTLSSELGPLIEQVANQPRVYADANMPYGVVAFMREKLGWDVLFVIEHPDLRRARGVVNSVGCSANVRAGQSGLSQNSRRACGRSRTGGDRNILRPPAVAAV